MNAYLLAGLPPLLVGIAYPPAFLYFAAIAAVVVIAALLLAGHTLKAKAEALQDELDRRGREAGPVVVDVTGDGGMDDLLLEVLVTPGIPEQRRPGGAS